MKTEIIIGSEGMGSWGEIIINFLIKKAFPNIKIIYSNTPDCDLIISSHFFNFEKNWNNNKKPYIYWSGESYIPKSNKFENKNLYILTTTNHDDLNSIYIPYLFFSQHLYKKRKYPNINRKYLLAYCNSNSIQIRETLFDRFVNKNGTSLCHALGKCHGSYPSTKKDNIKNGWGGKEIIDTYKDYKFVIAMENKIEPGYITEKMINAFYSGAIPIFWGCSTVNQLFNEKAFINVNDFENLEECVNYVSNMSDKDIIEMTSQPIYTNSELINLMNDEYNSKFGNKILNKYINKIKVFLNQPVLSMNVLIICSTKDSLKKQLDIFEKKFGYLQIRLFIVMNGVSKKLEPILKKIATRWGKNQDNVNLTCIAHREKLDPNNSDFIQGNSVDNMIIVTDNMTNDSFMSNANISSTSNTSNTISCSDLNTVLYVFITHQAELEKTRKRVANMMQGHTYLITVGGVDKTFQEDNVLYLQCNDRYEGLPEKVIKMYEHIVTTSYYDNISHVIKLDSDMKFFGNIPEKIIKPIDYGGKVQNPPGNRSWHIGRCSKDSPFNKRPYQGQYVPWCLGGHGYVLSRKALLILSTAKGYFDEIYEDLYVAKILREHGVMPILINNMNRYFKSPVH